MSEASKVTVSSQASLTLVLLTAVYGINFVDRQIVGLLLESIKRDLQVSDTLLGILTGFSFALFYTGLSLPIARLAERRRPTRVIAACTGLFSLATMASAAAMNYWQLLVARLFVGVGEAGTTPASLSLLSRIYPEQRRASAMAFFSLGAQVGVLIGFVLAGVVAARFGWRAGFIVAGAPGLLLTLLVMRFVPDPAPAGKVQQRPMLTSLSSFALNRSFILLCLGGGAALFALNATTAWMPAYLVRALEFDVQTVGIIFGGSVGIVGALTTWASGRLADRLYKIKVSGPLMMVAGVVTLNACLLLGALWSPQASTAVLLLVPGVALGLVWQGPVLALLQALAPEGERATATALFIFVANLIGLGLGPLTVGVISDAVGHGTAYGLRVGLSGALLAGPLSGVLFLIAAGSIRRDLSNARDAGRPNPTGGVSA